MMAEIQERSIDDTQTMGVEKSPIFLYRNLFVCKKNSLQAIGSAGVGFYICIKLTPKVDLQYLPT
jgi:hypothetical protein